MPSVVGQKQATGVVTTVPTVFVSFCLGVRVFAARLLQPCCSFREEVSPDVSLSLEAMSTRRW